MAMPILLPRLNLSAGREVHVFVHHHDGGNINIEFSGDLRMMEMRIAGLCAEDARALGIALIEAADLVAPVAAREAA